MSRMRQVLALPLGLALLGPLAAQTAPKGDPKVLIDDTATRQAQLKRAFESLRQKLAVLAGRLENGDEKDRDRAKAIRKALKYASDAGTEEKFDSLARPLRKRGADRDLDLLNQVIRDNKELRDDLRKIIALLSDDDRDRRLAERKAALAKLLEQLKELKRRQERLQAQTELGKRAGKEQVKDQEKLTEKTREVLAPSETEKEQREMIRRPIEEAVKRQKQAEGQLGKGDKGGAGDSQGAAAAKIGEAIRLIENSLEQVRQEERERQLNNLLARCKAMLVIQVEVLEGTESIANDLRKSKAAEPTLQHAARANKLVDTQEKGLREADGALALIRQEGSAVAFAEALTQVKNDMEAVRDRLGHVDVGTVTRSIERDLVETLKDMIRALEKAIRDNQPNEPTPGSPGGRPPGKQKLVDLLQQLKMVHAMQRRVNERTGLYARLYKGEQAPATAAAADDKERRQRQLISKELKDLSARQERIGQVTRELGKENPSGGDQ